MRLTCAQAGLDTRSPVSLVLGVEGCKPKFGLADLARARRQKVKVEEGCVGWKRPDFSERRGAPGGFAAMRKSYTRIGLVLLAALVVCGASLQPAAANAAGSGGRRSLGTVTGTVRDSRGNPLEGALVTLLRDGADEVIKEMRSAADGTFKTTVAPGRYILRAVASGFNPVSFTEVNVRASNELVYRFNLQPAGQGRTTPERRIDRDDPKFKIRSSMRRRSIFNVDEETGAAVETAENNSDDTEAAEESVAAEEKRSWQRRPHGVVETFYGFSADGSAAGGLNFAALAPVNQNLDLIFAGQAGAFERFETTARLRVNDHHRVSTTVGGARLPVTSKAAEILGDDMLEQFSVRAVDAWVVREGVVVVVGLDYSRFLGAGGADSFSPRLGFQFDAGARTRLRAAYAPGTDSATRVEGLTLGEDVPVNFKELAGQTVEIVDGRAILERSQRLEFGVERVIDERSSVEATVFFDTVNGRGVGLLSMPVNGFATENGAALAETANQQGGARGLRVVYTRRISQRLKASAGYAYGRGQQLSSEGITSPDELFQTGAFQTAAAQVDADVFEGTRVRTVLRFSPKAAVFAIDPFAGRLAVYDPSLSILVTQELPTFGLPVRAEAILDARNLLDTISSVEDGETTLSVNALRRMVRGGISVRF
jgi:hypothetical protein